MAQVRDQKSEHHIRMQYTQHKNAFVPQGNIRNGVENNEDQEGASPHYNFSRDTITLQGGMIRDERRTKEGEKKERKKKEFEIHKDSGSIGQQRSDLFF